MKKTLQFTEQELNVILFALQKQPFEMVNGLIQNIVGQLQPVGNNKEVVTES
jgi:hypothetical protein